MDPYLKIYFVVGLLLLLAAIVNDKKFPTPMTVILFILFWPPVLVIGLYLAAVQVIKKEKSDERRNTKDGP
jgi:hypothetical protein